MTAPLVFACPTCGTHWSREHPAGVPTDARPDAWRQCPDCARAQAEYDDARADARADL
jgi:hypothetical protein